MTIHSELFVWAFFFPLDKPDNDHYFFIGVPFYIKEAENDQQGQIGNGDEHAIVEEGKKYSASQSNHISPLHLCRVLCAILFFPFSFLYLIPFFHFSPPPRRTDWNAINSTDRNPRSGSPWIACSPTRSVNKCRIFYAKDNVVIDFVIQLSCQVCIV